MKLLRGFDNSAWRVLGTNLQVPHSKLNEIAADIAGRPHGQCEALSHVVDYWLKNDLERPSEKLAMAVEACGDRNLEASQSHQVPYYLIGVLGSYVNSPLSNLSLQNLLLPLLMLLLLFHLFLFFHPQIQQQHLIQV